jgi:hypothetical protein
MIDSINKKLNTGVPWHNVLRSPSHMRHSQGVVAIAQDNQHLSFPITRKKSGVSKESRSLLRKLLSRREASISLQKFNFLEDEIEFVDIVDDTTEGQHHARIFRITAGGEVLFSKL